MIVIELEQPKLAKSCQCCFGADRVLALVIGWRDATRGQTTGVSLCAGCRLVLLGALEIDACEPTP